jgi:signal transduction histidine kinase
LVRDVFREVQESDADISSVVLLDEKNRVIVAYPGNGSAREGERHPFADLDQRSIFAAQGGLFVATEPQSRVSLFFMNAYGPVVDLFGNEYVVGLKADVGYQKTIDSLRYGILSLNLVSGVAVIVFAYLFYRAGRRMALEDESTFRREKLATLGQLAGGVAHEIRNPLGIIKQATFLLRKQKNMTPAAEEWLGYMEDAVQRMNHLVEDVLGYARKRALEIKVQDITDTVDRAVHLVNHKLDAARIQVTRHDNSPAICAYDESRMEQVVVNLLLNAIEAMPEGGTITIRTRETPSSVELDVEDTGPGIPPDRLDRVMEPFQTGKETGTGLGLAIVRHIVESHGGTVTARSRLGEGTCFTVRVPKNEASPGDSEQ